jgi:hypothetical protein
LTEYVTDDIIHASQTFGSFFPQREVSPQHLDAKVFLLHLPAARGRLLLLVERRLSAGYSTKNI